MGIRHVLIFIPNAHFIKVFSSCHNIYSMKKPRRLSNIPILPLIKGFLSLQGIWTLYASTSWSLAGQGAYSGPAPLLVLLRLSPAPHAAPLLLLWRVLSEPPWHIHCGAAYTLVSCISPCASSSHPNVGLGSDLPLSYWPVLGSLFSWVLQYCKESAALLQWL